MPSVTDQYRFSIILLMNIERFFALKPTYFASNDTDFAKLAADFYKR